MHELTLEREEHAHGVPIPFLAERASRRRGGLPLPPFRPALAEYQAADLERMRREGSDVDDTDSDSPEWSDSETDSTPPPSPSSRAARKPIEGDCEI